MAAELISNFRIQPGARGGDHPTVAVAFENMPLQIAAGAIDQADEVGFMCLESLPFTERARNDFFKARDGHCAGSF